MSNASTAIPEPRREQRGALLRVLGIGFGLAVVVGGTIGVGILRTPGSVANLLRDPTLILVAWILGGLYCMLVANNLSELMTAIPRAGGPYVAAREAFGDFGGFLVGWGDWLTNTTAIAYLPMALAEFLARLVPSLQPVVPYVACAVLLAFLALQLAGVRAGSGTQRVTSLLKAVALLAFVALCFTTPSATPTPLDSLPPRSATGLLAFAAAMQLVIGTYGGWYAASYFSEEDENPGRNLPRALLGGLATILVVYALMNAAYLHALPMSEFASSTLPAASAVQRILGGASDRIVTGMSILLLLSIVNALLMAIPRILFAMARDGLFFRQGAHVNRGGTPSVATTVTVAAAMLLILTGSFQRLFALSAVLIICIDVNSTLSLLVLRRRRPSLARPWRALGAPVTSYLALTVSSLLLVGFVVSDVRTSLLAAALLVISWPVYALVRRARVAR